MNGPEVQLEGTGKAPGFPADVAQVPGEDHLHELRVQVFGDGQVPFECGVAVLFVHGLIGIAATGADKDFLKSDRRGRAGEAFPGGSDRSVRG